MIEHPVSAFYVWVSSPYLRSLLVGPCSLDPGATGAPQETQKAIPDLISAPHLPQ